MPHTSHPQKNYTKFYFDNLLLFNERILSIDSWSIKKKFDIFNFDENPEINQKDIIYMKIAKLWSENSKCDRMKVGSIIVKEKSIISDGYNGTPSGFPDKCETLDNLTIPHVLHAEANAITKLARSTQSSEGSTIYVTLSPCLECSKLIIQSGIKRVVFSEIYRNPEPLSFLAQSEIEILKINLEKYAK